MPFFTEKVRIKNKRYQHREVVARLLFIEHSLVANKKIIDTKKIYLDAFVKDFKKKTQKEVDILKRRTEENLQLMNEIFENNDSLLNAQSTIPIYYLIIRRLKNSKYWNRVNRDIFVEFDNKVNENKEIAALDIQKANFELLDFDRMSIQGTNDAVSIRERTRILKNFITDEKD